MKHHININGKSLDLSTPAVMAIANLTPDSFYDGGKLKSDADLLNTCEKHIKDGASIVDLGGQSTRPGAQKIGAQEEINRILSSIDAVKKNFSEILLSIDTFHSEVAKYSIDRGADIINDISGGIFDDQMLEVVSNFKGYFVLSHIRGSAESFHQAENYHDIVDEVKQEINQQAKRFEAKGFSNLILDPGFGFSKNTSQNFALLNRLEEFHFNQYPTLVGLSRKSMIWKTLESSPTEALNGTSSLHTVSLLKGASILRVHDVKEAKECITLFQNLSIQ